ncbi:solute carrier organic anion transporter family member 2B1-like [Ciona intestinalis]
MEKCEDSGTGTLLENELIETKNHAGSKSIFTRVRTFVAFLSLLQLVQVMGSGYNKSALTSIERRYQLTTFTVGILQSCFHIGNLSVILFVSYFGSKWHRPRVIAFGSLIMASSCVMSALPQFAGGRYGSRYLKCEDSAVFIDQTTGTGEPYLNLPAPLNETKYQPRYDSLNLPDVKMAAGGETKIETRFHASSKMMNEPTTLRSERFDEPVTLCTSGPPVLPSTTENKARHESDMHNSSLYIFIAVGNVLKGIGHAPLHPLGISFIDDYATPANSAVYIGVISALSLLGPAFGFMLGSLTTSVWVDIGWVNVTTVSITPHHPSWVGAWWVGYLVIAFMMVLVTIPLCMFNRVIRKESAEEETHGCICSSSSCFPGTSIPDKTSEVDLLNHNDSKEEDISKRCQPSRRFTMEVLNSIHEDEFFGEYKPKSNQDRPPRVVSLIAYLDDVKSVKSSVESVHACDVTCRRSTSAPVIRCTGDHVTAGNVRHENTKSADVTSNKLSLADFGLTLKRLLRDPVFMSITTGFVSLTSFLAASITFIAKYMETQFDLTASLANLLHGCVNLPMAVIGNILGGWIIRRKNLDVQKTLSVIIIGLIMTIVSVGLLFMFGCDENDILGLAEPQRSDCVNDCDCGDVFDPVCDVTSNVTYNSACHAGCKRTEYINEVQVFFDCSCIRATESRNASFQLTKGSCERSPCWNELIIFLILMASASMFAGVSATPSTLTILRVVDPSEKGFAIGIVFVFTRFLAWIPSPVYVGSALDSACLIWSSSSFDGRSNEDHQRCQVYNNNILRRNFFGLVGLQLLFAVLFYLIALYLVTKSLRNRDVEICKDEMPESV